MLRLIGTGFDMAMQNAIPPPTVVPEWCSPLIQMIRPRSLMTRLLLSLSNKVTLPMPPVALEVVRMLPRMVPSRRFPPCLPWDFYQLLEP